MFVDGAKLGIWEWVQEAWIVITDGAHCWTKWPFMDMFSGFGSSAKGMTTDAWKPDLKSYIPWVVAQPGWIQEWRGFSVDKSTQ